MVKQAQDDLRKLSRSKSNDKRLFCSLIVVLSCKTNLEEHLFEGNKVVALTSRPNALWHNVIQGIYEIQPNDYATKFGSPITMHDPRNITDSIQILFYSQIKSVGL